MTEKRFELAYSNDLENDKWWAVRDWDITLWKEEVVHLLNEQSERITDLEEKEIELGRNYLIKLEFEQKVKETLQKEIYNINEAIFNINNQIDSDSGRYRLNDKYRSQKELLEKIAKELGVELE